MSDSPGSKPLPVEQNQALNNTSITGPNLWLPSKNASTGEAMIRISRVFPQPV